MRIRLTSLFLFILLVGLAYAYAGPDKAYHPLTLAHRGANMEEDEDTLAAYSLAADYGVDMVETDPRLTADGRWVIMHDPTVERTTNGVGAIAQMTLAEIKALNTTPRGEEVPTLDEVLELAHERGVGVYLDMKVIPTDWAEFIALLERRRMKDKVIVGLWWKSALVEVESKYPEITTNIAWPKPVTKLATARKLGADYVGTLKGLARRSMIQKSHKLGLKIVTMPINSEKEMKKFMARGLDILQTDDPRLLVKMGITVPLKAKKSKRVGWVPNLGTGIYGDIAVTMD